MGFLERLISDVVRDNTGVDPRRLVRMIGGKNLLMLGGAAIAGGVIAAESRSRCQSSRMPQVPPPLPKEASKSSSPPPLPPLPPAIPTSAAEEQDRVPGEELVAPPEVSEAIIRVMAAAGLADGRLAESEREKIRARLIESDLSDEQIERINLELIVPASIETLSSLPVVSSSPELREILYRCAGATVLVDGNASEVERDWLDRLATALGLEPSRREELESELST